MLNFEAIPSEIKALHQWCVYKLVLVDGKETKVPYSPLTGQRASTTNPATWTKYDAATAAFQDLGGYDGICFMLAEENGIVFIDLDDCLNERAIEPWALEIAKRFNSYTERSQSGKGLHILIKAIKPRDRCRTTKYPHKVEIYSRSRQCCLTGDVVVV